MGAPFSSSLKPTGGGGLTAKNYLALTCNGVPDLSEVQPVAMNANASEGGPFADLNADTVTVDILATGIYVVTAVLVAECTEAVAASPLNFVSSALAFTTADVDSLAATFSVNGNAWGATAAIDQSQTEQIQLPFTTPPLALAAGDSFQWLAGLFQATPLGVTVGAPSEFGGVAVVRIG